MCVLPSPSVPFPPPPCLGLYHTFSLPHTSPLGKVVQVVQRGGTVVGDSGGNPAPVEGGHADRWVRSVQVWWIWWNAQLGRRPWPHSDPGPQNLQPALWKPLNNMIAFLCVPENSTSPTPRSYRSSPNGFPLVAASAVDDSSGVPASLVPWLTIPVAQLGQLTRHTCTNDKEVVAVACLLQEVVKSFEVSVAGQLPCNQLPKPNGNLPWFTSYAPLENLLSRLKE